MGHHHWVSCTHAAITPDDEQTCEKPAVTYQRQMKCQQHGSLQPAGSVSNTLAQLSGTVTCGCLCGKRHGVGCNIFSDKRVENVLW